MNLIDDFFLETNSNPDRVGCPPEQVIQSLAAGQLPLDHPARLHLGICSECFAEFQAFKLEGVNKHEPTSQGPVIAMAAATITHTPAAPMLRARDASSDLRPSGASLDRSFAGKPPNAVAPTLSAEVLHLSADMTLGAEDSKSEQLTIPKGVIDLQIILAPLSELGPYRLLFAQGKGGDLDAVFSATGIAVDKEGEIVIRVMADLSGFREGAASLTFVAIQKKNSWAQDFWIVEGHS